MQALMQYLFEETYRRLVAQGEPSIDPYYRICRYRLPTEDGRVLRCAAGMWLPDDAHEDFVALECMGIDLLLDNLKLRAAFTKQIGRADLPRDEAQWARLGRFLSLLQGSHDKAALTPGASEHFLQNLRDQLRTQMHYYGLDLSILDEEPLA